jgi:hypothetical protein
VYIELDIFSGRSNPKWESKLNINQILFASNTMEGFEWNRPTNLGYRGLILDNGKIEVYNNVVKFKTKSKLLINNELEKLLLEEAYSLNIISEIHKNQILEGIYSYGYDLAD